jgi:hypothetical protein
VLSTKILYKDLLINKHEDLLLNVEEKRAIFGVWFAVTRRPADGLAGEEFD